MKQFEGNSQISSFLRLSRKTWENKNMIKKKEFLKAIGAEYKITEQTGKATIYTIYNEEEVEVILDMKEEFGFHSSSNLKDFSYCLNEWKQGSDDTNIELSQKLSVSSQVIGAWKRKLQELNIISSKREYVVKEDTSLHKLYFIIDKRSEKTVYIGITNNLQRRMKEHFIIQPEKDKPLYKLFAREGVDNFKMEVRAVHEDRFFIEEMERQLITFTPNLLNVIHNKEVVA